MTTTVINKDDYKDKALSLILLNQSLMLKALAESTIMSTDAKFNLAKASKVTSDFILF